MHFKNVNKVSSKEKRLNDPNRSKDSYFEFLGMIIYEKSKSKHVSKSWQESRVSFYPENDANETGRSI